MSIYTIMDSVIGLAFALLTLPALYRFAPKTRTQPLRPSNILSLSVFIFLLCGMLAVTGLPYVIHIRFDAALNLIPFTELIGNTVQYVLNIILFVPFGLALPLMWQKYRSMARTVAVSAAFSLFIELAQLFCYRATDIEDLIANTLGGAVGFLLWMLLARLFPRVKSSLLQPTKLLPIIAAAVIVMTTVQPFVSNLIWKYFLI